MRVYSYVSSMVQMQLVHLTQHIIRVSRISDQQSTILWFPSRRATQCLFRYLPYGRSTAIAINHDHMIMHMHHDQRLMMNWLKPYGTHACENSNEFLNVVLLSGFFIQVCCGYKIL